MMSLPAFGVASSVLGSPQSLYAQAVSTDDDAYRRAMTVRMAFYRAHRDGYREYLRGYLAERYRLRRHREAIERHWPDLNVVRHVVDTLAGTYMNPPQRVITDAAGMPIPDDEHAAEARRLLEALDLDGRMIELERRSVLLNSALAWIRWSPDEEAPVIDVIGPHQVYIDPDVARPNDVQALRGLAVEIEPEVAPHRAFSLAATHRRFLRYTREDDGTVACALTDIEGHALADAEVPWPERMDAFPFVKVDEWDSPDRFHLEGNDDLLSEPLAFAWRLAELRYAMQYTAFPQLVANVPPDEAEGIVTGPGMILSLPEAEFKYLQPDFNFGALQATLLDGLKAWALTRDIPPQDFDVRRELTSGAARMAARAALWEARLLRTRRFARAERELWRRVTALHHLACPDAPDLRDTTLQVSFPALEASVPGA